MLLHQLTDDYWKLATFEGNASYLFSAGGSFVSQKVAGTLG